MLNYHKAVLENKMAFLFRHFLLPSTSRRRNKIVCSEPIFLRLTEQFQGTYFRLYLTLCSYIRVKVLKIVAIIIKCCIICIKRGLISII